MFNIDYKTTVYKIIFDLTQLLGLSAVRRPFELSSLPILCVYFLPFHLILCHHTHVFPGFVSLPNSVIYFILPYTPWPASISSSCTIGFINSICSSPNLLVTTCPNHPNCLSSIVSPIDMIFGWFLILSIHTPSLRVLLTATCHRNLISAALLLLLVLLLSV